jgi:predicted aconitase
MPTYSAIGPVYARPGKFGEHVTIAESISILWYNTMYGARSERDDGVTSLAAAITGYCPLSGVHLPENRLGEVVIRPGEDLDFSRFQDADWGAFSLAASRLCKEKRPVFVGMPSTIEMTDLMHLLSVIAVESGLALLHIVGLTPEAPTLEKALGGKRPDAEYVVGRKELLEAHEFANTTEDEDIDFVLLGCPHLTMKEIRDLAETLDGRRLHERVKLVAVTTKLLHGQAKELGYVDAIERSGAKLTYDMCIAFAGTQVKGVIATNSLKADFFYSGFSAQSKREIRYGSLKNCSRAALTGKWKEAAL